MSFRVEFITSSLLVFVRKKMMKLGDTTPVVEPEVKQKTSSPKKTKKQLSQKQIAALREGREKRNAMLKEKGLKTPKEIGEELVDKYYAEKRRKQEEEALEEKQKRAVELSIAADKRESEEKKKKVEKEDEKKVDDLPDYSDMVTSDDSESESDDSDSLSYSSDDLRHGVLSDIDEMSFQDSEISSENSEMDYEARVAEPVRHPTTKRQSRVRFTKGRLPRYEKKESSYIPKSPIYMFT